MTYERKSEFILDQLLVFPLLFFISLLYYAMNLSDIGLDLFMVGFILLCLSYILRDKIPMIKKVREVRKLYYNTHEKSNKFYKTVAYNTYLVVLALLFAAYIKFSPSKNLFWIPLCGFGLIYLGDYKKGLKIFLGDVLFRMMEYILYVIIIFYNYNILLRVLLFILFCFEFIYLSHWIGETEVLYYTRFNSESSEDKTNIREREDKLENG